MRSFLVACIVAVALAVGAAVLLNSYVPNAASTVYSTSGTRI
jgi:hypothetical protein